jgi:hypothetical protein
MMFDKSCLMLRYCISKVSYIVEPHLLGHAVVILSDVIEVGPGPEM